MLTSSHTSSVTNAEEISPMCLNTPLVNDVSQPVPIDLNSDQSSTISGEASPPSVIVEAVEEMANVGKHSDVEHVEDCDAEMDNIEVIMDDSDNSKQCNIIDSVCRDGLPIHNSLQDTSFSIVDTNLKVKPRSSEFLHQNTTPYDSILISPEAEEAEALVDLSLSPTFSIASKENSAHDLNILPCSPSLNTSQGNTVSCSSILDVSNTHNNREEEVPGPEESFEVITTSCGCSHVLVSSSPKSTDILGRQSTLSPSDDINLGQHTIETSYTLLDSPPLFADYATTPNSPLYVESAPSGTVPCTQPESVPSVQTLKTPRDLRAIARTCLEGGSDNSTYETPAGIGRLPIESDDNITPMPNYRDMFTPLLKAQCGRFGVKQLPKRKMIAKLQEIYEYTHPLVGKYTRARAHIHTHTH